MIWLLTHVRGWPLELAFWLLVLALARASGSTSTWRATARPSSPTPASSA